MLSRGAERCPKWGFPPLLCPVTATLARQALKNGLPCRLTPEEEDGLAIPALCHTW